MSDLDPAPVTELPSAGESDAAPGLDGASGLGRLAGERRVVICCGPGGVGKTTVSASFAVQGARLGRRTCVVTVDPARRLADSLGVESLVNGPTTVEGDWAGHLDAVMLDTKGTFDDLVFRYAPNLQQAEAIIGNRVYQNLSGALSGTQEYMAMEKLYELTGSGRYDLVVVDTPPSRNALDLLDAPGRLTRFLENRLFRALLMPTRAYLRAVSVATRALLRTISSVAGAEIVQDAVAFFQAFEGMEEGFRSRAGAVRALLADPTTAYVVVSSPQPDAVEEAAFFADRLGDRHIVPAALVVNRVQPRFGQVSDLPEAPPGTDLWVLTENLRQLEEAAAREAATYAPLVDRAGAASVGLVPLLTNDVHDLPGLLEVATALFDAPPASPGGDPVG